MRSFLFVSSFIAIYFLCVKIYVRFFLLVVSSMHWFHFPQGLYMYLVRKLIHIRRSPTFHKFTTFFDGSDLYLSAFVIIRCSLKVFPLFLRQNSYIYQIDIASWGTCLLNVVLLAMFFLILSMFRSFLRTIFSLVLFQQFMIPCTFSFFYLCRLMFSFYWKGHLLLFFNGGVGYEMGIVIPAF